MNSVTDGQQNIDQPTIVLEAYPTNSPLSRESHVQLPIEEASGALIEYENEQSQIHEEEQLQTQEEEDFAEIINNNLSNFPMEFAMEMIKKIYQEKSQSEETLSQLYQGLSKLMGDDKIYESFLNEYLTIKHKQMKSEQAARAREGKYKKNHRYDGFAQRLHPTQNETPKEKENPNPDIVQLDLSKCTMLQKEILKDIAKNLALPGPARRFEDATYEYANALKFHSPTSQEITHNIFGIPGYSSLQRHFRKKTAGIKAALEEADIMKLIELLSFPTNVNGEKIYGTIAIDAVKVDEWSPNVNKQVFNNIFAFYFMPLNCDAKKILVATVPYFHGKCTEEIRQDVDKVLESLKKVFIIPYVCTDGDSGYRDFQKKTFEELPLEDFAECLRVVESKINAGETFFITDVIHYAKNRRTMLIFYNGVLVMSPIDDTYVISIESILSCYDCGDALHDFGKNASMNDEYPIALFSIPVMASCFFGGKYGEEIYLASVAFWLEAIRNPCLDQASRLCMLRIAYLINLKYYKFLVENQLPNGTRHAGRKRANGKRYFFAPVEALERALQSILVLYYELARNPNLNFSRMTTMSLEHLFGLICLACCHRDTHDMMLSKFAELLLMQCTYKNSMFHMRKIRTHYDFQTGPTLDPNVHNVHIVLAENDEEIVRIVDNVLGIVGFGIDYSHFLLDISTFMHYLTQLYRHAAIFKISKPGTLSNRGAMISVRYVHAKKEAKAESEQNDKNTLKNYPDQEEFDALEEEDFQYEYEEEQEDSSAENHL